MLILVSLEKTLLASDLIWEGFSACLKKNPAQIFRTLPWLQQTGEIPEQSEPMPIDWETLPYHSVLLHRLRTYKKQGAHLFLLTQLPRTLAEPLADHLQLFERVWYLSSPPSCQELHAYLEAQKNNRQEVVFITAPDQTNKVFDSQVHIQRLGEGHISDPHFLPTFPVDPWAFLKAIRLAQWSKNLLIFLPLLTSHTFLELQRVFPAITLFLAFSLISSGVYLLNDILDVAHDRRHSQKQRRPLARGTLSLTWAIRGMMILWALGGLLVTWLDPSLLKGVALYWGMACLYAFYVRKLAVVDVLWLASLFCLRILLGIWAIQVPFSMWLLNFSFFLFLSLSLIKRYTDVLQEGATALAGRGYQPGDQPVLGQMGLGSGIVSVLVLVLYTDSAHVVSLYQNPALLLLLCPLLLYWLGRVWLLAYRGQIREDPILFLLKDPVSYGVMVLGAAVVLAAKFSP